MPSVSAVTSAFLGIRRHAPAMLLTLGVLIGEVVSWYLTSLSVGLAVAFLGCLIVAFARRGVGEVVAGVLLGIITSLPALLDDNKILSGADVSFQGVVRETPRRATTGQVVFELDASLGHGVSLVRCRGVDLPWRNSAELVAGATVWVRGTLEPTRRPANPFSWEGWLWRRGVVAECKALFISKPIVTRDDWIAQARESARERSLTITDNERGLSLLLSMALGYRDVLSPPLERAFSTLGLTHLLVVSGYQVSMVFGFVMALAVMSVPRWTSFRYWRESCGALALAVTCVYVALIGAEMSAVRAFIAAAFICSQRICETRSSFAQRWAVALLMMQLLWPYCVFDIGVILTFAALAGIGIGAAIGGRRKIVTWLAVTCSVWVFTSIVVVAWNGSFSVVSVPLNLILAAPWSALNCTVGLVSLVSALLGVPGGRLTLELVARINSALSEVLMSVAELPVAGWTLAGVYRWGVLGVLCCVALTLGFYARRVARRSV